MGVATDFYYPFDSVNGDRVTTAATERRFFSALYKDGVIGAESFAISFVSDGVFSIGAGIAIIGGAVCGNISAKEITAQPAQGVTACIVLRLDTTAKTRNVSLGVTEAPQTSTTQAQLEEGGILDMILYTVDGQTGGGYGVLDQRKYCRTFESDVLHAEYDRTIARISETAAKEIEFFGLEFSAALSGANAEIAGLYGAAGRQGFINPTFAVNQRGRSSYGLTSGTAYTFDRWQARIGGAAAASPVMFNRVQDGERMALEIDFPGFVDGNAAAACIAQNIEGGVRTFCAGDRSFTVSFDAKASEDCRISVEPTQIVASGGAGVAISAQSVGVTTSWQRFSLTFRGNVTPSATQLADVLKIAFFFAWRGYSDRFGTDQAQAVKVYLANMQINEGSAALPCYVKPYADELEACQRYYVSLGYVSLAVGATLASSNQVVTSPLPITRRLYKMPTVTPTDRANVAGFASVEVAAGGWRNGLACVISNNSADAPVFIVTNTDSAAVTRVCFNSLALDAEITD